ncbi:MAG TPA: AI-2E family transporter [Bacteroidales bacterium]|jgi:predicted PurR-regulated permease PerM|nr:AI-2E family transporter [Bacteroidales bacterium]
MKQVLKYTGYILTVLIIAYLLYKFYYIIVWIFVAAALSFMGAPLVKSFDSFHIRKIRIPHGLSALLALLIIVLIFLGLIAVFVPLIISQADTISRIDVSALTQSLEGPMEWLNEKIRGLGALPEGQSIQDFLVEKVKSVVNVGNVGEMISRFISAAGNIFVGLFSIVFIAFFFLKDDTLFEDTLLLFIPEKKHASTHKVIEESKKLLIRYYLGVILELICVMTLITVGLKIFGIKNALLIGFFGGMMNIIPYIGPWIGAIIGIVLGITSTLAFGSYNELMPAVLKLAGVFAVVNFIDNNILVPVIYSKSVKSHPLEIFIVIIVGGGLAGIVGMLFAVPVYTLFRVIAGEFFQQFRIVKKITETINKD